MSSSQTVAPFVFVIDTDQYAGKFERQMCAFLTGSIGECGVGDDEQSMFKENGEFPDPSNKTSHQPDDRGCSRPASIWLSLGRISKYNSVAIFFSDRPTDEEVAFMKKRADQFISTQLANDRQYNKKAKPMKIKGFRLITQRVVVEEVAV